MGKHDGGKKQPQPQPPPKTTGYDMVVANDLDRQEVKPLAEKLLSLLEADRSDDEIIQSNDFKELMGLFVKSFDAEEEKKHILDEDLKSFFERLKESEAKKQEKREEIKKNHLDPMMSDLESYLFNMFRGDSDEETDHSGGWNSKLVDDEGKSTGVVDVSVILQILQNLTVHKQRETTRIKNRANCFWIKEYIQEEERKGNVLPRDLFQKVFSEIGERPITQEEKKSFAIHSGDSFKYEYLRFDHRALFRLLLEQLLGREVGDKFSFTPIQQRSIIIVYAMYSLGHCTACIGKDGRWAMHHKTLVSFNGKATDLENLQILTDGLHDATHWCLGLIFKNTIPKFWAIFKFMFTKSISGESIEVTRIDPESLEEKKFESLPLAAKSILKNPTKHTITKNHAVQISKVVRGQEPCWPYFRMNKNGTPNAKQADAFKTETEYRWRMTGSHDPVDINPVEVFDLAGKYIGWDKTVAALDRQMNWKLRGALWRILVQGGNSENQGAFVAKNNYIRFSKYKTEEDVPEGYSMKDVAEDNPAEASAFYACVADRKQRGGVQI